MHGLQCGQYSRCQHLGHIEQQRFSSLKGLSRLSDVRPFYRTILLSTNCRFTFWRDGLSDGSTEDIVSEDMNPCDSAGSVPGGAVTFLEVCGRHMGSVLISKKSLDVSDRSWAMLAN